MRDLQRAADFVKEPCLDVSFHVTGGSAPLDHGYALYSALSKILPAFHEARWLAVHPLTGLRVGNELRLSRGSRLRLRLPANRIRDVLVLAGKRIELLGNTLQVGVPEIHALRPAAALQARLVNIKGFEEENQFREAALRQLTALEIQGQLTVGRRRVMRIKDKTIVGFRVVASELTAEESIALQEHGIGGRRRMGCGIFVPLRR
jgi:CRISPR-associated protein Cas6